MKNLLLLLSVLIVVPAWAGDAVPVSGTGVVIELKGSAKSLSVLVADLEKDAVYKAAECSSKPMKKSGKTAKITCAQADGALLAFLAKNAPANVHWSISAAATKRVSTATSKGVAPLGCPTGCSLMNCPPPGGPVVCCKNFVPC